MLKFIQKLFGGSPNERELRKIEPLVGEINAFFGKMQALSDEELRAKTDTFKAKIREALAPIEADQEQVKAQLQGAPAADPSGDGAPAHELTLQERVLLHQELDKLESEWQTQLQATLDELLPEAFAVVKEACRRHVGKSWIAGGTEVRWDMVPYDVQLIGGIVLHKGRISEMKTGEGKTLVAVAPVYLNALAGRGVHLVTVNPYLAQRDCEWMRPIFEFLGLTSAVIDASEPHSPERKAAYDADITYGTNNEFGFDYLRDNSFVTEQDQLMQRYYHFAIVDEIDSVLIDEARTPLIISGPVPQADEGRFAEFKPYVDKLVFAQKKLVGQLVSEADRLYAAGKNDEAGLALLRAHRGFPKNKQLMKLKGESGIGALLQKTEYFYLQDNARNMPEVDEALYYAIDERQHSIEMTDKGREYITEVAQADAQFFVIPDVGEEIAVITNENKAALEEASATWEGLEGEEREEARRKGLRQVEHQRQTKERDLYATVAERADRIHAVNQLLRAYTYYERDVEYIVEDGKILIVDEQTGRVLPGRRYSEGLHQAIEAKENVKVQVATQTYATITLQNYFRMYAKLAGMTGTAETEAGEFFEIYKLDVNVIPTNKPVSRNDLEDLVFRTKREKINAVIDKIAAYQEKGQPVLVGTTSVEVSETISRLLQRRNIKHNVLNAKLDRAKQEALIVAEAGQRGGVTIATNMAGRGTDIKLANGISELGGLAILGTERHESRRIDLQLRGRAGRQGDPGESQFYVSLEDNLMRLFGHDRTAKVMDRMGLQDGEVITHPWVTKSIERAQKKVEQNNFSIRKRQLEYDDVLNAQRQVIYDKRMHALKGERLRGDVLAMLQEFSREMARRFHTNSDVDGLRDEVLRLFAFDFKIEAGDFQTLGESGLADRIYHEAVDQYNQKRSLIAESFNDGMRNMLKQGHTPPEKVMIDFTDGRRLFRLNVEVEALLATNGQEVNDTLERSAVLATVDERWVDHLRELDDLKEGIGLRAYGQKDPLVEYKVEAFQLFSEMMNEVNESVLSMILRATPVVEDAPRPVKQNRDSLSSRLDRRRAKATHDSSGGYGITEQDVYAGGGDGDGTGEPLQDPTLKQAPIVSDRKYGRNDRVTVANPVTGETREMKYKDAQAKLQIGWTLVD